MNMLNKPRDCLLLRNSLIVYKINNKKSIPKKQSATLCSLQRLATETHFQSHLASGRHPNVGMQFFAM